MSTVVIEEEVPVVIEVGVTGPQGPPGTLIEVSEEGVLAVTPLRELDFQSGFDVTETAPRVAQIALDLSEVSAGGELGGTLNAPTVDALHSGSTHQSFTDNLNAHLIDVVDAHDASAVSFVPTDTIVSADAQSAIVEALTDGRAYTDDGHVILSSRRGAIDGVAELDGTGKVPVAELPALAFGEVFVVASEAAMLALAASPGDIAVRTDTSQTFILSALPASTLANWVELLNPGGDVTSVNGRTGAVTGLEEASNKGAISGYAALDGSGYVPDAQINPAIARDTEVSGAISTHEGASDPHPTYLTTAEGAAAYDALGAAATAQSNAESYSDAADAAHVAASDPHPGYETAAEAQALVDVHTSDTSDAHDASAVSVLDSAGNFAATDVEASLAEFYAKAHTYKVFDAAKDYGVVADGTGSGGGTDNYAAIQSLITAVNAYGRNCRIVWPKGTVYIGQYKITGGGSANGITDLILTSITGLVFDATGTKFDHKGNFNRADDGGGTSYSNGVAWYFDRCTDLRIYGGEFDGNVDQMTKGSVTEGDKGGVGGGLGLAFRGCTGIELHNVEMHHFSVDNITVKNAPSGTPRLVTSQWRALNCSFHSAARNNFTVQGLRDAEWINCHFDDAGHTDAAGTAVGTYGFHAPHAGMDHEGTLQVGTGSTQASDFNGTSVFRYCTFSRNGGAAAVASHPYNTKDVSFEHCTFDITDSDATYGLDWSVGEAYLSECTIIALGTAAVRFADNPEHKNISTASWASNVITFDTGTGYHGLEPGMITEITSSNPSGYNGYLRVLTVPSLTTFTVYTTTDPGTYVSGATFSRPVLTIVDNCTFYSAGNGLNSGTSAHADYDLKVRRSKFYSSVTSQLSGNIPNIQYDCSEFTDNYIFVPAPAHDGVTVDIMSKIQRVKSVRGNTYETDLVNRGVSTLYFTTDYTGCTSVQNERYISGQYWRPEATGTVTPADYGASGWTPYSQAGAVLPLVGADDTIPMWDAASATGGLKAVASATPSTQAFGDAAAAGTSDTFTRGDHKHAMMAAPVTSLAKSGSSALTGTVTLTGGTNVTLTQSGQDVSIAAGSGTGAVVTDTVWDAAGDLVQGTGADAAAKLARGTSLNDRLVVNGTSLAWVPHVVGRTADSSAKNDNTLANDDTLLFAIAANESWFFQFWGSFNGANTTMDGTVHWSVPASCTMRWGPTAQGSGAAGSFQNVAVGTTPGAALTESSTPSFGTGTAIDVNVAWAGWIFNGANAGTVNFQWAQSVTNAGNLILAKGSALILWRIA